MGKRPGGTAVKVWGILLVCLGGLGVVNVIAALAMAFGGFSGSQFAVGLTPDAKAEMERMVQRVIEEQMSSWLFWASFAGELAIAVLSVWAGVQLLRSKPQGARLALARAAMVLLTLPIWGIQQVRALEIQLETQQVIMEHQIKSSPRGGKSGKEIIEEMQPIMRGMAFGAVVVTAVFVLLINGLLAFMITRPTVKEYLANAATEKSHWIPGYDPSMGLLANPPGQGPPAPPSPGQGPPDQPPAGPPVFSTLQNPRR
ncbi:MAG: hypothetical protein IT463_02410 [Planctomycetes bacterium]|nr:hypothetical protein [Planctomycetota bacterium]